VSLDTDIVEALDGLAAGGIFATLAPQNTPYPFITYQRVGGVPTNTLAGESNGQNARIQFNVWAYTLDEALTIMAALKVIVTTTPFRAVSLGEPVAEYNAPTKGRGARQDFSFWHRP
jgi:hypothetical protein